MSSLDSSIDSDLSIRSLLNSTAESVKANDATDAFFNNQKTTANNIIDKIIILYLRHKISLVCLEDVVQLINMHREIYDQLPSHKVEILKMFRDNKDMIDVFYFIKCFKCGRVLKESSEVSECCGEILKKDETNFFVYMPLRKQISQSIEKNWKHIKKIDISNNDDSCISDAHHGRVLRDIMKTYENDDINILSLCLNTDGVNIFESGHVSLWPIQFSQNYLPPKIRFLPDNILVGGLMYTENKFDFREYFLPIVDELNNLKEDKIILRIEEEDYVFKPVVSHCTVDLPAKSKFQEMKQHNGYDSCTYCLHPGEQIEMTSTRKAKKNQVNNNNGEKKIKGCRYTEGDTSYPLRDVQETLNNMLEASSSKNAVQGVKNVSCLVALEHFNIIKSMGIDYMHCVLLGMQKKLTESFCNSKYSKCDFYIPKKYQELLNKRILAIKPNREVVRKPRSLQKRSKFKASEYRSMLLYYFPVCLPGCIPDKYVQHIRLLASAVYVLLKSSIRHSEINESERKLLEFVLRHQQLFGKEFMVINAHLLKHLADAVRELGPLWCQSNFAFERNNGHLVKRVVGTTDVLLQVSSKYCLSKAIINESEKPKSSEKLLLGKSISIVEQSLVVFNIKSQKVLDLSNVDLIVHKRIILNNVIYTSKLYTRPKKTIDYFIGLKNNIFGMAKFYFESNGKTFVVMEEFKIGETIDHIFKVEPTRRNIMALTEEIKIKYLYMKVESTEYITSAPNPYEME